MDIYSQVDYREILKNAVRRRKVSTPKFGFKDLAEAARIQKSYLSKVLAGSASLSSDQLYLISQALGFNAKERDYLLLLLERDKTALDLRRHELDSDIARVRTRYSETQSFIKAPVRSMAADQGARTDEYYLNPLVQIVHVGLSIARYIEAPRKLASDLGVPGPIFASALQTLERLGYIQYKRGKMQVLSESMHLARDAPVFRTWRSLHKLQALQRLNETPEDKSYSFSTVFSADQATALELRRSFLALLKHAERRVEDAPAEQVFQMSFDLFPWTFPLE